MGVIITAVFLGLGLYMVLYAEKPYEELYEKATDEEQKGKFLRDGRSLVIYGIVFFVISAVVLVISSFIPIGWFRSWRQKKRDQLNKRLRRRQIRVISYDPPDVEYITDDSAENKQRF